MLQIILFRQMNYVFIEMMNVRKVNKVACFDVMVFTSKMFMKCSSAFHCEWCEIDHEIQLPRNWYTGHRYKFYFVQCLRKYQSSFENAVY